MARQFESIDEYIASFPENVRTILQDIRETIHKAVPQAEQTISYDIPAFTVGGRYLVYFAGWQKHVSVYPVPEGDAAFQQEIAAYRSGKGTLRFPLNKPIPYELIERLTLLLLRERPAAR